MPLSWLAESICVDESVWRFRWQEMGWRLLSLSWILERPEGVWVGSWSEQKVGLGIGCWQGLRAGPAVGENCSHVYVPMWEAAERPEDEGDSSWTGCMLGWASILIGWCSLGVLCVLSMLICVASQVYSDIVCVCVALGKSCSSSPQAGPKEMALLPLLGYLIGNPSRTFIVLNPQNGHTVIFFLSHF